jgi:tetratricopeptide (TPR) repeat protein
MLDWRQVQKLLSGGFDAILATLRAYRDGRSDEQVSTSVLRTTPEAFDAEFDAWLRARSNPALAREFVRLMTLAGEQLEQRNTERAKTALQAAGQMFTVSGGGSPFTTLAQIYLTEGNKTAAIDALQRVSTADESAYEPNLELARLYEEQGDLRHAANALERAMWINPYTPAPHVKLAELYAELGDHAKAVRERRVVVGLRPTDRAEAHYQLAVALQRAGDRTGARREVLRALEAAPSFGRAQELLLQLHEGP